MKIWVATRLFSLFSILALFFGCLDDSRSDTDKGVGQAKKEVGLSSTEALKVALEFSRIQERMVDGEKLFFKPNHDEPYTGWVSSMHTGNSQVKLLGHITNGRKHGSWLEYYSLIRTFNFLGPKFDRKSLSANFFEGKEHGVYQKWFANGSKSQQGKFKMGKMDGEWKKWYQNKTLGFEGIFDDGKPLGTHRTWWKNGQPMKLHSFSKGVPHGVWWEAFENGQKTFNGHYSSGTKHGVWVYYFENGQKKMQGSYDKDQKIGEWTFWDKLGRRTSGPDQTDAD